MNLLSVYNSIVKTGGATYNLCTREFNPDSGYGVAQKGFERSLIFTRTPTSFPNRSSPTSPKGVMDQIYNRRPYLPGVRLNDGKIYFDIVERIPYLENGFGRRKAQ